MTCASNLHPMDAFYAERYRGILRLLPWNTFLKMSRERYRREHGTYWAVLGLSSDGKIWNEVYDERTLLRPAQGTQPGRESLLRASVGISSGCDDLLRASP